jgi:hypothetical protein
MGYFTKLGAVTRVRGGDRPRPRVGWMMRTRTAVMQPTRSATVPEFAAKLRITAAVLGCASTSARPPFPLNQPSEGPARASEEGGVVRVERDHLVHSRATILEITSLEIHILQSPLSVLAHGVQRQCALCGTECLVEQPYAEHSDHRCDSNVGPNMHLVKVFGGFQPHGRSQYFHHHSCLPSIAYPRNRYQPKLSNRRSCKCY